MTLALVVAAVSIGSMHTLAPDHWVPFAALARAERWPAARTALVTALCGFGHVTVSVMLGLLSTVFGLELLQRFGTRLESIAGFLLIGFGMVYGLWGVHRAVRARWHDYAHGHSHPHHHGDRDEGRLTAWTLFLLFSADPCVAVIPVMFAAAPLGWANTLAVIAAYELATIGTMVALVLPARAVTTAVRGAWADRYGDALAGGVIAATGLLVVAIGV